MLLRRVATLVLLAFLLGPASNLACLISCAPAEVAATTGECHGTANQQPAVGDQQSCADTVSHSAPFVKPAGVNVHVVAVPVSQALSPDVGVIEKPFPVRVPGAGPPGRHSVLSLRI